MSATSAASSSLSSSSSSSSSSNNSPSTSTNYWALSYRKSEQRDLGHKCKECKLPFSKLGETIGLRRGGRIELKYHENCLVQIADPRAQPNSSANTTSNGNLVSSTAPENRFRKMRTNSHF